MNENLITWNITNWITVVLMVVVGVAVFTLLTQGVKSLKPAAPTNLS